MKFLIQSKMLLKIKQILTLFIVILCISITFPSASLAEEEAYFAGGCFWCLEHDFEDVKGVLSVESGYSGGEKINPTYEDHQGYQEAISIKYDPQIISYEELLRVYWRNIDPLDDQGQFCDKGNSYKAKIFTVDIEQEKMAQMSKKNAANELNDLIVSMQVVIEPLKRFWLAEEYHQDYAQRNPLKYKFYRFSCGRDSRLLEIWNNKAGSMLPWDS